MGIFLCSTVSCHAQDLPTCEESRSRITGRFLISEFTEAKHTGLSLPQGIFLTYQPVISCIAGRFFTDEDQDQLSALDHWPPGIPTMLCELSKSATKKELITTSFLKV